MSKAFQAHWNNIDAEVNSFFSACITFFDHQSCIIAHTLMIIIIIINY